MNIGDTAASGGDKAALAPGSGDAVVPGAGSGDVVVPGAGSDDKGSIVTQPSDSQGASSSGAEAGARESSTPKKESGAAGEEEEAGMIVMITSCYGYQGHTNEWNSGAPPMFQICGACPQVNFFFFLAQKTLSHLFILTRKTNIHHLL